MFVTTVRIDLPYPPAMTTMTTVGYGDITAVTVAEQLVRSYSSQDETHGRRAGMGRAG